MRLMQRQLRLALVMLLASAAVLLAVGTIVEHHQPKEAPPPAIVGGATGGQASEAGHGGGEAGEQGGEGGGEGGSAHPTTAAGVGSAQVGGERFLGVAESLPLTAAAVATSLALAVAVWVRPARPVLWAALLAALVLAAADGRELAHHLHEARAALATIAGVLLGMHLAAASVAALLTVRPSAAIRSATAG